MYDSLKIAERIKELAKERNVTIKELLERSSLSKNTINKFKDSIPRADNIAKIADVLECSIDYLMGREEKNNSLPEEYKKLIMLYENCDRAGQEEILKFAEYQKINNPKQKTTLSNSVG